MNASPIGVMIWYSLDSEKAYLWLAAVDKSYQKNGIGSRLFERMMEEIYRKGYRKALVKTKVDNSSALSLLKGHGFKIIGQKTERSVIVYWLEKDLKDGVVPSNLYQKR